MEVLMAHLTYPRPQWLCHLCGCGLLRNHCIVRIKVDDGRHGRVLVAVLRVAFTHLFCWLFRDIVDLYYMWGRWIDRHGSR